LILPEEKKFTRKCVKVPFFYILSLLTQLYIARVGLGSGEHFSDPDLTVGLGENVDFVCKNVEDWGHDGCGRGGPESRIIE